MTQQQQETQPGSDVAAVGGWPRPLVASGSLLAGAAFEYAIGLDAFWPVLVGAVATAVGTVVVDIALSRAAGKIGRHMKVSQIATVLAIALAVALFYRVERNEAFGQAFGHSPPSGVSHLDIDHVVDKESGKHLTVVEFQASRETLDALIANRKFVEDPRAGFKPGKEAKAQRPLWHRAFIRYGISVEERWKNRLPVTDPVIYHWVGTERETLGEQTSILWDADSGRGCAIHSNP